MQAVRVYNLRDVDELVFLDIAATPNHRPPDFELVADIARECFMPLTVGGGVNSISNVEQLLRVGADKVAVGTAIVEQPQFLQNCADRFGSQCMVACLDVRRHKDLEWEVVTHCGNNPTGKSASATAKVMESNGAGEIILNSIDQDGTMEGYDYELASAVAEAVRIPLIVSGGAGTYQHMVKAIKECGANAVAAASLFHFTEQTPNELKRKMAENGIPVRTALQRN